MKKKGTQTSKLDKNIAEKPVSRPVSKPKESNSINEKAIRVEGTGPGVGKRLNNK